MSLKGFGIIQFSVLPEMLIAFSSLMNMALHDIPYSLFIYHTYIYTWHSSMLVNLVFSQKWLYSPHAPSHITDRCWAKRCIYDDDPYVVMPRMLILITSHLLYHITVSGRCWPRRCKINWPFPPNRGSPPVKNIRRQFQDDISSNGRHRAHIHNCLSAKKAFHWYLRAAHL